MFWFMESSIGWATLEGMSACCNSQNLCVGHRRPLLTESRTREMT